MAQETQTDSNQELNNNLFKTLDGLVEEVMHIYEIKSEEAHVIHEISDSIRVILNNINAHVQIAPSAVSETRRIKEALLNLNGEMVLTYSDDHVEYKKLEQFSSMVIIDILNDAVPKLKETAIEYRKKITQGIHYIKKANKELSKMKKILQTEENLDTNEDIVSTSLEDKQ